MFIGFIFLIVIERSIFYYLYKGGVKEQFYLFKNFRCEFTLSITFKAIDSPERYSTKKILYILLYAYCLMSMSLHVLFKNLSFIV